MTIINPSLNETAPAKVCELQKSGIASRSKNLFGKIKSAFGLFTRRPSWLDYDVNLDFEVYPRTMSFSVPSEEAGYKSVLTKVHILALGRMGIGEEKIKALLEHPCILSQPLQMYNTLKKIAEHFQSDKSLNEYYQKKVQGQDYSWLMGREGKIYVRTENLLGMGSSKIKVTDVICLNNLETYAGSIVQDRQLEIGTTIDYTLAGEVILKELSDIPNVMNPSFYTFQTKTKDGIQKLILLSEKLDGTAQSLVKDASNPVLKLKAPIDDILVIIRDVANALSQIHKKGYVHSDVKASNILIKQGKDGRVIKALLHDFDGAGMRGTETFWASGAFLPTESFEKKTNEHDAFSLGVTIIQLLMGTELPEHMFDNELLIEYRCFINLKRLNIMDTAINHLLHNDNLGIMEFERYLRVQIGYREYSNEDLVIANKLIDIAIKLINPDSVNRATCEETYNELSALMGCS